VKRVSPPPILHPTHKGPHLQIAQHCTRERLLCYFGCGCARAWPCSSKVGHAPSQLHLGGKASVDLSLFPHHRKPMDVAFVHLGVGCCVAADCHCSRSRVRVAFCAQLCTGTSVRDIASPGAAAWLPHMLLHQAHNINSLQTHMLLHQAHNINSLQTRHTQASTLTRTCTHTHAHTHTHTPVLTPTRPAYLGQVWATHRHLALRPAILLPPCFPLPF